MSITAPPQPYQLPAGILAVAVHCIFFALLYFGFTWQNHPATTMSVELWQQLQSATPAPPPPKIVEPVAPAPVPVAVPPPIATPKPDIVIPDKRPKVKVEKKPPPVTKPVPAKTQAVPELKKIEVKLPPIRPELPKAATVDPAVQQAERARAAMAAARQRSVDEFIGKIVAKVRRNIVMPPDVADDARTEFTVTLLPDGSVLTARLTKSSGNAAYDNAVERAIAKSQPLPLPADAAMFNDFRKLNLGFKPKE